MGERTCAFCRLCFTVWLVKLPKALISTLLGVITGVWFALPYIAAAFGITLIRLPVNFYITYKVAFTSIIFKPGLRILILFILPVIHILAPVIVLIGAVVAAPIGCIAWMTFHIYNWQPEKFLSAWKVTWEYVGYYWDAHKSFHRWVREFAHETGIPRDWTGNRYGIPFGPLKVINSVLFLFYGFIVVGFGAFILSTVKFMPGLLRLLWIYSKAYLTSHWSLIIIGAPFFVLGLGLILVGFPAAYLMVVLGGFLSAVYCPGVYFWTKFSVRAGFLSGLQALATWDRFTKEFIWGEYLLYICLKDIKIPAEEPRSGGGTASNEAAKRPFNMDKYWDLFAEKCDVSCQFVVLDKRWMDKDNVLSADPSVILGVPAIAALNIAIASVEKSDDNDKSSIHWNDALICDSKTLPEGNHIIELLWPKMMKIREHVNKNKENLTGDNLDLIIADICAGQDDWPEALKSYLENKKMSSKNKILKGMLIDLSLCLSRIAPMTVRMASWQNRYITVYT